MVAVLLLLAVLLDRYAGDRLRRAGLFPAELAAAGLYRWFESRKRQPQRSDGVLALALLLFPMLWVLFLLQEQLPIGWWWLIEVIGLYWALGLARLHRDALAVQKALVLEDTDAARRAIARLEDDRDPPSTTDALAERAAGRILQRSADALFGPVVWWLLAGLPGALGYRLLALLAEHWGGTSAQREGFGWAATRFHDWSGVLPAWLTAMTFVLVGRSRPAFAVLRATGDDRATGNRSLVGRTGQAAMGPVDDRLGLGGQTVPDWVSVSRSLVLVRRAVFAWLLFVVSVALLAWAAQGYLQGEFALPGFPV